MVGRYGIVMFCIREFCECLCGRGWGLTMCRLGEVARDEGEMGRCWEEIWGVLKKEGAVE